MDKYEGTFSGHATVTNVSKIAGDSVIHLRKGKLWPLCDLQLVIQVKVSLFPDVSCSVEILSYSLDTREFVQRATSLK